MSFRKSEDLFAGVYRKLAESPMGSTASAIIQFQKEPEGYDGKEKLVCWFQYDPMAKEVAEAMDDDSLEEKEGHRKVESNALIDDRSVCTPISCGLSTTAIFPKAYHLSPSSSPIHSDVSTHRMGNLKPVTPNYNESVLKLVPHLLETHLPSDELASNLNHYLKMNQDSQESLSSESNHTYSNLELRGTELDVTTDHFDFSECEGL